MYRPKFCAECGERITRTRWRVWTSRSFCQTCEGQFRRRRILVPLMTAILLLSTGLLMGRAIRPQPAPLTVERGELPTAFTAKTGSDRAEAEDESDAASSSAAPKPEQKYGPDGTATERPTDPEEIVSLCGARTQKGTPCQRRVRGTGRCWQHRRL